MGDVWGCGGQTRAWTFLKGLNVWNDSLRRPRFDLLWFNIVFVACLCVETLTRVRMLVFVFARPCRRHMGGSLLHVIGRQLHWRGYDWNWWTWNLGKQWRLLWNCWIYVVKVLRSQWATSLWSLWRLPDRLDQMDRSEVKIGVSLSATAPYTSRLQNHWNTSSPLRL